MTTAISFQTAGMAIGQIFLMGAVGFFLTHRSYIKEEGLKTLAWVSVNVAFPFFIFKQICTHFHPSAQPLWWSFPLVNITLAFMGLLLGGVFSRLISPSRQAPWMATSAFHNAGYIPLLLATMLVNNGSIPADVYAPIIISIIGFDLCLWSIGVVLITRDKKGVTWRHFVNPPIVTMALAFIFVLVGGEMANLGILEKPLSIMGDGALMLAMLTIGGNLGLTRFHQVNLKDVLGAVGIKLLFMPLVALVIIKSVDLPVLWELVLMIQACMPSAITLSIIARHYGSKEQDFINQVILYSHLLSILTIPIMLGLYGVMVK